jgi:hypothetical protein
MDDLIERLDKVCRELEKNQLWTALKDAEYVKKHLTDKEAQINEELRGLCTLMDPCKVVDHGALPSR